MKKFFICFFVFILVFEQSAFAWSFFKKTKNDKKTGTNITSNGYKGTLPDISKHFQYKIKESESAVPLNMSIDEIDKLDFKTAPFDDSLFLDVIVKKQKTSPYIGELLKIQKVLENFRHQISENCDIQRFNANVNVLNLHVAKLQKKYNQKSEALTKSYLKLQELNYRAKILGNLKYEADYFSKFQPVLDDKHSQKYIKEQEKLLLNYIDKAIFQIKTECDEAIYPK